MKHAVATPASFTVPATGPSATRRTARFVIDRFLLLPAGALIALAWANTASESYFRFAHALSFAVNDVAMALVIGLLAQEVAESIMPGGALHSWRKWTLPLVGAAGGIAGSALTFTGFVYAKHELVLAQAWPVACAIDIAAAYYLLRLIWPRSGALPFVLLLGIATDAFGLLMLAFRPTSFETEAGGVLVLITALTIAMLFRQVMVRSFWPYLVVCGSLSWLACYLEGVHTALALIPVVPFLPHEPRRTNPFADTANDDVVHRFEHEWNEAVQIVLFFFGLVNAGVLLRGYDTGTAAVLVAALVGRPIGILAAVGIGVAAGLRLPHRVGVRGLIVVALATSSGFMFALFFATGLLPMGAVLTQIKLGALATVAGAGLTVLAAKALRAGSAHPR